MELKGARPGRFLPRCPQCTEKFALVISADANVAPQATKLAGHDPGDTLSPAISMILGIDKAQPASRAAATIPPYADASVKAHGQAVGVNQGAPVPASRHDVTAAPPVNAPQQTAADVVSTQPIEGGEISKRLGGYELVRKLGQGGMGSVFLARQLSLDRNVALKVLLDRYADDPQFVARFIREAYAAAQLTHHNVVQIHDIGAQQRTHFFSMQCVEGSTLASIVERQGPVDPEAAVNYVLQAARGLRFAHELGLIHRDVKPENLMLNRHGIVKVADLGLVKTADSPKRAAAGVATGPTGDQHWYEDDQTQVNISMGTPAYMPPEQATDAHNVDLRADIYSLGATLYMLLVGHPPFTGSSTLDVINRHQKEKVKPPHEIVPTVPQYLSQVALKMLAKRPADRYQNMDQVIKALEEFMGVETAGPFNPTEQQVQTLQQCVQEFNTSGWAKAKVMIARAFLPVCAGLLLITLFLPVSAVAKFEVAAGVIGFAVMTPLAYSLIAGLRDRTYLFSRVRELFLEGGIVSLFCWLVGLALVISLLYVLQVQLAWLIALVAALGAGAAFHFLIDPSISDDRIDPLGRVEGLLKKIRQSGVSEAAVQQFVCKHAGEHWEEFYETLFGYESKIMARQEWGRLEALNRKGAKGDRGRPRPMHAAWRDPIIEWIDARQQSRHEARDRRLLEAIERENFKAKGFPESAARKKARNVALSIVLSAAELRELAQSQMLKLALPPPAPGEQPEQPDDEKEGAGDDEKKRKKKPVLDDEGLEGYKHQSWFMRRFGGWAGFFLGPPVRFILGALLIAGCMTWVRHNDLLPTERVTDTLKSAIDTAGGGAKPSDQAPVALERGAPEILRLDFLPDWITRWFGGWQAGIAGAMLVLSAFVTAPKLGLFVVPAALVIVVGAVILPSVGSIPDWAISSVVGALIAFMGFRATRD
jgi:serine/threonine protein kinase